MITDRTHLFLSFIPNLYILCIIKTFKSYYFIHLLDQKNCYDSRLS